MAAGKGKQFVLLLWKNWMIQRRKICCTVTEIIVPVLLSLILVLIHLSWHTEHRRDVTTWTSFDVDALKDSAHHYYVVKRDRNGSRDAMKTGWSYRSDRIPVARSLVYAPDTPLTQQLMTSVTQRLQLNQSGTLVCFGQGHFSVSIAWAVHAYLLCRNADEVTLVIILGFCF